MDAVHPDSMLATVDMIDEALFYNLAILPSQKEATIKWIVARPFSAVGMPAPTRVDYEHGVQLFTGERIRTRLAINHILGIEACRILRLIGTTEIWESNPLQRARSAISHTCFSRGCVVGECAHSAVAFWRLLAVGELNDLPGSEQRIRQGMSTLSAHRDGVGRWKRFPFYYTLLALLELPYDLVCDELHYALPACRRMRRTCLENRYEQRRVDVVKRVIARIEAVDVVGTA